MRAFKVSGRQWKTFEILKHPGDPKRFQETFQYFKDNIALADGIEVQQEVGVDKETGQMFLTEVRYRCCQ